MQTVQKTVKAPQVQFLDRTEDFPIVIQRVCKCDVAETSYGEEWEDQALDLKQVKAQLNRVGSSVDTRQF